MKNSVSFNKNNHKTKTEGFLYCSFSENYVDEAVSSIRTLIKHNPKVNVCLITTTILEKYFQNNYSDLEVDKIICVPFEGQPNCFFRTKLNEYTPYKKTIALDTDTYILDNICNLFDLLDTFDLVMVPDESLPARSTIIGLKGGYSALGYYNCGFIVFRKSDKTDKLFKTWGKEFLDLEELEPADQGPLVRALVKTELRFITLPKEYNTRLFSKCTSIHGKVKIIHGRAKNPNKLANKINNINLVNSGSRVWIPNLQILIHASKFTWYARILSIFGMINVNIGAFGGLEQSPNTRFRIALKIPSKIISFFRLLFSSSLNFFSDFKKIPFGLEFIDSQTLDILTAGSTKEMGVINSGSPEIAQNCQSNVNMLNFIKSNNINNVVSFGKDGLDFVQHLNSELTNSVSLSYFNTNNMLNEKAIKRFYPNTSINLFDLVYCGKIPDPTQNINVKKVIKKLCFICCDYLIISIDLPISLIKNKRHPRASINYDYPLIQWIVEEGFYFDPHLTIKLRETASNELFKNTALIFQKYK
jgi:hypothetical protein